MASGARGAEYRVTTLCIDSCENGVLTGRLYNPFFQEGRTFLSLTQFLWEMEQVLNEMNFPQSSSPIRTFLPAEERAAGPSEPDFRKGEVATFELRILFRQNVSWQGSLRWLETKQEQNFRSVLELIFLLSSALEGTGAQPPAWD